MKLIEEVVDYCYYRGMLGETQLLRLQEMGLGRWIFDDDDKADEDDKKHGDCCDCPECRRERRVERRKSEEDNAAAARDEADELRRVERHGNARLAARRKAGGGGSRPKRKTTTASELDALLAPLLDAIFADDALSRCVVKLGARAGIKETSNVRDAASLLARLSESELITALTQALDANGRDRLSLNDVYAAILAWPDLAFLEELSGGAVDACRTLLREDYSSGVAGRDAWLLGESNGVRDLYWWQRFKRGLIAALRTVYATDEATFKRWSTDGGRLPFPGWAETKKAVDTTCWSFWAFGDRTPREVAYVEWETTSERLNDPRTLALRLALTDSIARDFSHLTVVDGDEECFRRAILDLKAQEEPPLFPAIQTVVADCNIRCLKSLPNLQTLTLESLSNVTDSGLSSLSGCANLQTLTLRRLDKVTDASLATLLNLPNLRRLEAISCKQINGGLSFKITLDAERNRRFDGDFGSDAVLKAFAAQFTGDSLRLESSAITDAGLSSLSGCANLQTLTLSKLCNVTDSGLSSLSGCAALQTLTLSKLCGVTDAGLSSLSGCAALQTLTLESLSNVTDAGLSSLSRCANLQTLTLKWLGDVAYEWTLLWPQDDWRGVTDSGLSSLSGCVNLQTLTLEGLNNVTDSSLSSLSGCANLQTLTLRWLDEVTDSGLSSLSGCANLQTLTLESLSCVTDSGLSSLSDCANLQTLTLESLSCVTDAGLSSLSGCANLQTLTLRRLDKVTDASLATLLNLPNLRRLEAISCKQINGGLSFKITLDAERNRRFDGDFGSDAVLKAFAAQFTGDSLRLESSAITDAGLSSLSGCANLQTLTLRRLDKVTDAGLSSLSGCANLRTLEIWRCDGVTDSVLAKLSEIKKLRSLSLNFCGAFTGVGVAALGAASNLLALEFWKCDGTSSADVDALRTRLPKCEIRFSPKN